MSVEQKPYYAAARPRLISPDLFYACRTAFIPAINIKGHLLMQQEYIRRNKNMAVKQSCTPFSA
jgi:hypothetical protein